MAGRWLKRWKVPSSSNPETEYTVARDRNGDHGCSCPAWKFRRQECHHIKSVLSGRYQPDAPTVEPQIVLANVRGVIPKVDKDGETTREVLTPLIPVGDTHFEATVVYDLLQAGVSWSTLKARYSIAKQNPKYKVIRYIQARGRRMYGPWNDARKQYDGFSTELPIA